MRYSKTLTRLLAATLAAAVTTAVAHGETPDSISVQELGEVVIQAPRVVRKADMDAYYPSRSAVDNSKNGMQLLRNIMIPSLTVNEALGQITKSGKSVEVRINGRPSTIEQVRTLLPETVKRVEWIDNPGLRYKGADAVLNFIVINPTLGGSVMAEAMPAVNAAWGNYFASAKLNNGRSQWEFGGNLKLTEGIDIHRDYHETFTYPDGSSLTRNETSLGGKIDNTFGKLSLGYSYIRPDTTVLYVTLTGDKKFSDRFDYDGLLSLSDGSDDIRLNDMHGDRGTTPVLSAYLEQHFRNNQMLVVDFSTSYYFGKSYHDYVEREAASGEMLTDVHTLIRDRNRAYGIEADYIKNWRTSRLTAGVSYTANRNRSTYENMGGELFHQRQDRAYLFAEYLRRIGKVTLTAGLGAQYTSFKFRESGLGSDSWNLRPQFSADYRPNGNAQLRLNFSSWQSAPSLSETNATPQQIDGFQWRVGNPGLETSSSYMLKLQYNFTYPRLMGTLGVDAFTSPNAITPYLAWEGDRLITSYENSRGLQNLAFYVSPQVVIVPGWLVAGGTLKYRAERMRGRGYKLYNHDWSGDISAQLMHYGFTLMAQYRHAESSLWGESISWGENVSVVTVNYNWKGWGFGAGMIMPFGKYDQGSRSLNRFNTNESHMRMNMRMPFVQVSYNLQWGRQKRGAQKLINADSSVDRSTAGGR